jgi:hypothetical protein
MRSAAATGPAAFLWAASATGLVAFAVLAGLYVAHSGLYYAILTWAGIPPFQFPFLDLQFVLAGAECWGRGVDVYVGDPCDVLGRVHNYSPLWLRIPALVSWTEPLGLSLAVVFLLSLTLLPRPRRWRELALTVLATLSTASIYAVERANTDLVIFLLAIVAGLLWSRVSSVRLMSYPVIVLAGLLKFYPMTVLVVCLREPPRILLTVTLAVVTVVVAFAVYFQAELAAVPRNIPGAPYFFDFFGVKNLPYGAVEMLASRLPATPETVLLWRYAPLALGALLIAVAARRVGALTAWLEMKRAVANLPEREAAFTAIGAVMICTCFFAGQSVVYRGVHFLLVLPGLLALWRAAVDPRERRLFASVSLAVVILMWEECVRHAAEVLMPSEVARLWWLARELLWWYVIAVLTAFMFCFLQAPAALRHLRAAMMPATSSGR